MVWYLKRDLEQQQNVGLLAIFIVGFADGTNMQNSAVQRI